MNTNTAEKTYTLLIAEVDENGNIVRRISDLTSDFETIDMVAKRKLRGLRAEHKAPVEPAGDENA